MSYKVPDHIADELVNMIYLYGERVGGINAYGQPSWSEDYLYGFPQSDTFQLRTAWETQETGDANIEFEGVSIWVDRYTTNGMYTNQQRTLKEWTAWLTRVRDFVEGVSVV